MARRLIAQDRYVFVLLREAAGQITEEDAREAWQVLNAQMALIPGGQRPGHALRRHASRASTSRPSTSIASP